MTSYAQEVAELRTRAHASLRAAERLLAEDFPDFAASRAYYAVFYAASALLLSSGKKFSKHSGVIAHIHKDYVKTGRLAADVGRIINALSDLRGVGDYGGPSHVDEVEAAKAVVDATQAVAAIERLLPPDQDQA